MNQKSLSKKLALLSILSLSLASCRVQDSSVSAQESSSLSSSSLESSVSSESSSVASSSSSRPFRYVDLDTAYQNTDTYELCTSWYVMEYVSEDIYYYAPGANGMILLDDDPDYVHEFTVATVDLGDDYTHFQMDVHGRINYASYLSEYPASHSFHYLLADYIPSFAQVDGTDNVYDISAPALGKSLSNFLQAKSISYEDYFQISVGTDGRLASFRGYETESDGSHDQVFEIYFKKASHDTFEAYSLWEKNGSKITYRIADYKNGSDSTGSLVFFYAGENVSIDGTVTAIDADKNLYVAKTDNSTGPVGIKVTLADTSSLPAIGTEVTVNGTLTAKGYELTLSQATVTKTGTTDTYLPFFNEEPLASSYGNGVYFAYLFMSSPVYDGSLVNFSAYTTGVSEGAEMATGTLVFPDFPLTAGSTNYLKVQIRIPKSLAGYSEIVKTLSEATPYGSGSPTLLSFSHALVQFGLVSSSYSYLSVELTDDSTAGKALTTLEKVQKAIGISTFALPAISSSKETCYSFGPATGFGMESDYGLSTIVTDGVHYEGTLTEIDCGTYLSELVSKQGFTLVNKIKDASGTAHSIYQNGKAFIDAASGDSYSGDYKLVMNFYQADSFVHGDLFSDKLAKKIPSSFTLSDYARIPGSYDADYDLFSLSNYAGNDYPNGLLATTIRLTGTQSDCAAKLSALIQSYKDEGYAQALDSSQNIVSYRTRAVRHQIYEKNGCYVDFSLYSTDDYTFLGSDDFTYRIEVLIYDKADYKGVTYEADMSGFNALLVSECGANAAVDFSLAGDVKIELYKGTGNGDVIDYGYGYSTDCFLYGTSEGSKYNDIRDSVDASLLASGYVLSYTTAKGNRLYTKTDASGAEEGMVFMIINSASNYIRLEIGVPGTRF